MNSLKFENIIPGDLYNQLVEHIKSICKTSIRDSWESSRADEDSLAGDFFASIRKLRNNYNNEWQWSIDYKKMRGRGSANPETLTGADGIFYIIIKDSLGNVIFEKSFIFQAKMAKNFSPSTTTEQARAMDSIAANGSIILVFNKGNYYVIKTDEYLNNKFKHIHFCDYLINYFFKCNHGLIDMSFDIASETLSVKEIDGNIKKYNPKERYQLIQFNFTQMPN